ncbi:hypothetical protein [Aeromonas veronii]|uniref:hypothetical protein n=2 Tax=Aeromonas TaxID=642 RepID=UPI002B481169|nr:hypothetical protein [Aeromonas veronii]
MMKVSRYGIKFYFFSILYIVVANFFNIRMFGQDSADGFYSQISYVSEHLMSGESFSPLFIIHTLRLIAILPFYISDKLGLPAYTDAIFFVFYMRPIISFFKYQGVQGYLPFIFLFFPLLFSYRSVLGMCSIFYLYMCLFYHKKNTSFLFVISALLANLSSGIVLGWAIAVIGSFNYLKLKYVFFKPFFILLCLGFLASLVHKYEFMFSEYGAEVNGGALQRSTFYVAYIYGQHARLLLYALISICISCILMLELFNNKLRVGRHFLFFLGSVPLLFFEGIGLVSYLFCLLLYISSLFFKGGRIENKI